MQQKKIGCGGSQGEQGALVSQIFTILSPSSSSYQRIPVEEDTMKALSHDKQKFANLCWQTQISVREREIN